MGFCGGFDGGFCWDRMTFNRIYPVDPCGKRLHYYVTSPFFIGKTHVISTRPFSIAM